VKPKTKCYAIGLLFTAFTVAYMLSFSLYMRGWTRGTSMTPTIHRWDTIIVDKTCDLSGDLTGRIVVFTHLSRNIPHRVIKDYGEYVQTKGDNIPVKDPFMVPRAEIKGVVISVLPWWFRVLDLSFYWIVGALCIFKVWKLEGPSIRQRLEVKT